MVGHYETLDRGGLRVSDQEKVMRLLESIDVNSYCIQTQMELVL